MARGVGHGVAVPWAGRVDVGGIQLGVVEVKGVEVLEAVAGREEADGWAVVHIQGAVFEM